eukprot:737391_1
MVDTKGDRIIINYPSPDLLPDAEWLEEIDFSQWDVVLADVRWHDGAKKAFTLARQAGVMTVLDGDITPQDISELVALSDHAAFSEPGLAAQTRRALLPGMVFCEGDAAAGVYAMDGAI